MPYINPKSDQAKANHRIRQSRWREQNPNYAKNLVISARPPILPCSHCSNSTDFFWRKDHWVCRTCSQSLKRLRETEQRRISNIRYRAGKLVKTIGKKSSDIYLNHALKHRSFGTASPLKIHDLCLPKDYQRLSRSAKDRIYQLNRLSNMPFGNIGWTCSKCRCYSGEFYFFDIDHITPRHKGGGSTRNNLQIVCPNCHRKKTIGELHFIVRTELTFLTGLDRSTPTVEPSGSRLDSLPSEQEAADPVTTTKDEGCRINDTPPTAVLPSYKAST